MSANRPFCESGGTQEWRAAGSGRGCRVRCSYYGRPEHPGSTEFNRPEDLAGCPVWTDEPLARFETPGPSRTFRLGFNRTRCGCNHQIDAPRAAHRIRSKRNGADFLDYGWRDKEQYQFRSASTGLGMGMIWPSIPKTIIQSRLCLSSIRISSPKSSASISPWLIALRML